MCHVIIHHSVKSVSGGIELGWAGIKRQARVAFFLNARQIRQIVNVLNDFLIFL
jgi:hypothetical protein